MFTISIKEKILGRDHLDTALSLNNLGVILREQGRTDEAGAPRRTARQNRVVARESRRIVIM